jgi:hypothetical protein
MDAEERKTVLTKARGYRKAGRGIGKLIGLTEAERQECKAWWLASTDGDMSRAMSRRIDGRQGRRERRAADGAMTQADYFGRPSERKAKPWEALGMSRRWYYVLKRRGELPDAPDKCAPDAPSSYKTESISVGASGAQLGPEVEAMGLPNLACRGERPAQRPLVSTSPASPQAPAVTNGQDIAVLASGENGVTLYDSGAPGVAWPAGIGHRVAPLASKTAAKLWAQDAAMLGALLVTWEAAHARH